MFCLITGVQRVTTSKWLLLLKLLSLFDNAPAVSSLCDHVPDMPPICPSAGYTDQNKLAPTPTSRFGPCAQKRGQTPAWNDEKVIPYPVATCRDEAANSVSCRKTPALEHSGERAAHKL